MAKLEKSGKRFLYFRTDAAGDADKRGRAVGDDPGVEPPCADRGRDHFADWGDPGFYSNIFFSRGDDER